MYYANCSQQLLLLPLTTGSSPNTQPFSLFSLCHYTSCLRPSPLREGLAFRELPSVSGCGVSEGGFCLQNPAEKILKEGLIPGLCGFQRPEATKHTPPHDDLGTQQVFLFSPSFTSWFSSGPCTMLGDRPGKVPQWRRCKKHTRSWPGEVVPGHLQQERRPRCFTSCE